MGRKFLLPCQCGRKLSIEGAQAGQRVRCECGADLEVPTMLGLAQLEEIGDQAASEAPRRLWGLRQLMLLLGGIVLLLAVAFLVFLWLTRPRAPDMLALGPFEAMGVWDAFRQGISGEATPLERGYADALRWHLRWLALAGAVALLGVLLIGFAFLVKSRPPQQAPLPDQPAPRDRAHSP